MAFLDFLFQGSPPPSVTTYGTSTTGLPQWLNDYTQGLVTKANAVAGEPYQPYGGPRVADFTPDQQQAFQLTRDAQGNWQSAYDSGQNAIQSAMGLSGADAAAPYLNQAASQNPLQQSAQYYNSAMGMNPTGQAAPYLQQGTSNLQQASAMNPSGQVAGMYGQAAAMNPYGQVSGMYGQAAGMNPYGAVAGDYNNARGINAYGMSQPYTNAASSIFPDNVDRYMSPYTDKVVDRIGDLAQRNLTEKFMPAINDQFTRAGQFGSSRQTREVGNTLRDLQESTLAAQSSALEQGYGMAGQLFNQDAGRLAGLAGQQGQLGLGMQSNLAQLAASQGQLGLGQQQNLGQLATQQGQLGLGQQSNLGNLAASQGQLGLGQMSALGSLAGQYGQMGSTAGNLALGQMGQYSNIGSQIGSQSQNYMNALSNIGQVTGNLTSAQQQNLGNLGYNSGVLGQIGQASALKDAAAIQDIGQQQQNLTQQNLNTAYGDFQNQVQYPWQQINNLSNTIRGLPTSTTSTSTNTAPGTSFQPSGLASIAGAGLSALSLANMFK
jgi:hypothetical protein